MRRLLVSLGILTAFVVAAEYFVGWDVLIEPWFAIEDPLFIVGPIVLLCASYLVRALRMYRYFQFERGFGMCLRLLLQHNVLLNLLPMRTGEFAFPVLMRRYFDVPAQRSIPALLWLRALDLHTLIAIFVLALATATKSAPVLWVGLGWTALPFLGLQFSERTAALLTRRKTKLAVLLLGLLEAVPSSSLRLAEDWLLTAANWLLKLAAFAWIIALFAFEAYVVSLVGAVTGELTAVLPVHGIGGFGTYEGAVVVAMQLLGATLDDALTGAVNLHLLVLGASILAAALALLIPLRRSNLLQPSSHAA